MYIDGYFRLLFVLTPVLAASEIHSSHKDNGNIRLELKFSKPLPYSFTCLLYLEFDNSIPIDFFRNVSNSIGHCADTVYPAKCKIVSRRISLVYPTKFNHAVWHRHYQCRSSHRERFTPASNPFRARGFQCLIFRLLWYLAPCSEHNAFLRRNCTFWVYNTVQLQGLTSTVCGHYCCLFALYIVKCYNPKQLIGHLTLTQLNSKLKNYSYSNSESCGRNRAVVSAAIASIKGRY